MLGKDKVVTVKPNTLMSDAAQLMLHNDVSSRRLGPDSLVWGSQANDSVMAAQLCCSCGM
jgi:hypothetical protein